MWDIILWIIGIWFLWKLLFSKKVSEEDLNRCASVYKELIIPSIEDGADAILKGYYDGVSYQIAVPRLYYTALNILRNSAGKLSKRKFLKRGNCITFTHDYKETTFVVYIMITEINSPIEASMHVIRYDDLQLLKDL